VFFGNVRKIVVLGNSPLGLEGRWPPTREEKDLGAPRYRYAYGE
jgi:hypothetical protein